MLLYRLFVDHFLFGFDGKMTRDLLDKIKAETRWNRGEPKGSLDFIQKENVYFGVKAEKKIYCQSTPMT
jgi:hypothetical protein